MPLCGFTLASVGQQVGGLPGLLQAKHAHRGSLDLLGLHGSCCNRMPLGHGTWRNCATTIPPPPPRSDRVIVRATPVLSPGRSSFNWGVGGWKQCLPTATWTFLSCSGRSHSVNVFAEPLKKRSLWNPSSQSSQFKPQFSCVLAV